jgi:hypothetical protein
MFHVWPLIEMPEAHRARDRIVAFLKECGEAQTPYKFEEAPSCPKQFVRQHPTLQ